MLKKTILMVIALCLMFSIVAMAENTRVVTDGSGLEASQKTPPSGNMQGRTPPDMPSGGMPSGDFAPPEGFTPPQNDGEFNPFQGNPDQITETTNPTSNDNDETSNQQESQIGDESNQEKGGNEQFGELNPANMGGFPGNLQGFNQAAQEEQPQGFSGFVKTNSAPITSVVLLVLAFIFVIFYRRKNY